MLSVTPTEQSQKRVCLLNRPSTHNPLDKLDLTEPMIKNYIPRRKPEFLKLKNPHPRDKLIKLDKSDHSYHIFDVVSKKWTKSEHLSCSKLAEQFSTVFDDSRKYFASTRVKANLIISMKSYCEKLKTGHYKGGLEDRISHFHYKILDYYLDDTLMTVLEKYIQEQRDNPLCESTKEFRERQLKIWGDNLKRINELPLNDSYHHSNIIKGWDKARDKGTELHEFMENILNGIPSEIKYPEWRQCVDFLKDNKHREPYRTEWEVFSERLRLNGTIDFCTVSRRDQKTGKVLSIVLWDHKRTYKIKRYEEFDEDARSGFCKKPWNHIRATARNMYSLQMSAYALIIETEYGLKVEGMNLIIFWPANSTYIIVECKDYRNEVKSALESFHKNTENATSG